MATLQVVREQRLVDPVAGHGLHLLFGQRGESTNRALGTLGCFHSQLTLFKRELLLDSCQFGDEKGFAFTAVTRTQRTNDFGLARVGWPKLGRYANPAIELAGLPACV